MELDIIIDERLWEAVENNYTSRKYSWAILDSFTFLSSVIRERAGLDKDEIPLIEEAFGGREPRIRINYMQNESDLIQTSIEQLLSGLYIFERGSRSYERDNMDTVKEAEAIIIFIDHFVGILDY